MKRLAMVLLATSVLLIGCGKDKDSGDSAALSNAACATAAPAGTATGVSLPQGFPQVEGVTFTASTTAGPTTITNGVAAHGLSDVYKSYKAELAKAPYDVAKSEKDDHDAEVNFESAAATGQVRLRECASDKTAVQITARPK